MEYTLLCRQRREITPDPAVLDAAEQERYRRLIDPLRREVFLAGRTLIKQTLAPYLGLRPSAVSLALTPNGKPYLPAIYGAAAPHFNLSHSGDYFVLGIASRPIGVDIELIRPVTLQALSLFFSSGERRYLEQLSGQEQQRQLFRLFTLKEALIKAVDRQWGINDISFRLEGGNWILEKPAGIFSFDLREGPETCLAICV